ncbi:MAG: hypothetical protein QXT25_02480 [Candidatus Anstonellaceae archaeon]
MKKRQKRKKVGRLKVEPETFQPAKKFEEIPLMEDSKKNIHLPPIAIHEQAQQRAIPHVPSAILAAFAAAGLATLFFLFVLKMETSEAVVYSIPILLSVAIIAYSYFEKR